MKTAQQIACRSADRLLDAIEGMSRLDDLESVVRSAFRRLAKRLDKEKKGSYAVYVVTVRGESDVEGVYVAKSKAQALSIFRIDTGNGMPGDDTKYEAAAISPSASHPFCLGYHQALIDAEEIKEAGARRKRMQEKLAKYGPTHPARKLYQELCKVTHDPDGAIFPDADMNAIPLLDKALSVARKRRNRRKS